MGEMILKGWEHYFITLKKNICFPQSLSGWFALLAAFDLPIAKPISAVIVEFCLIFPACCEHGDFISYIISSAYPQYEAQKEFLSHTHAYADICVCTRTCVCVHMNQTMLGREIPSSSA